MARLGAVTRVQPRYQVTLPKDVRCELGIEPGDDLLFYKGEDGSWRVRRKVSLLELMDEARAQMKGDVTLEDVIRWRREEDAAT